MISLCIHSVPDLLGGSSAGWLSTRPRCQLVHSMNLKVEFPERYLDDFTKVAWKIQMT